MLNWYSVEAGIELRPLGAVPVLVEVVVTGLLVVLVGGVDEAVPGRHWL